MRKDKIEDLLKVQQEEIFLYRSALIQIAYITKKMTILDLENSLDLAINIAKIAISNPEINQKNGGRDG